MNRVSKRSGPALVLAFALLAGLVLLCVRGLSWMRGSG